MADLNETVKLKGSVKKQLFDESGVCIYEHTDHNLIVTTGFNYTASYLATGTPPFMSYMGLGTGSTPPTSGNTGLQTPLPTYVQGTLSSPSSAVWQNVTTFGPGVNTGAITEAGVFNDSSGDVMLARQVFAVINKGSGNSLVVTWQISLS